MTRCILLQSGLHPKFWADAASTANYIRNRCPSRSLNGKTPFEVLSGKIPNVDHFREFGNRVYVLNNSPGMGKLDSRGVPGIFVGYSDSSKGYRIWIPDKGKIVTSRDVNFLPVDVSSKEKFEDFCPDKSEDHNLTTQDLVSTHDYVDVDLSAPDVVNLPEDVADDSAVRHEELEQDPGPVGPCAPSEVVNTPPIGTRGRACGRSRIVRSGERGRPRKEYHYHLEEATYSEEIALLSEVPMREAMSSAEAGDWWQAMVEELRSIIKNDTWDLIDQTNDSVPIGSRLVLRNKANPNGSIQRRKAKLVAQGFSQRPGVHFNETFAPVARLGSIRLMISLAARYGMRIHQLDVTTAYLNERLEENVLMKPPRELKKLLKVIIDTEQDSNICREAERMLKEFSAENKVCKLKKALYGLRQAGQSWYLKINEILKQYGATPTNADTCLYHIGKGENILLIAIYVDDILICSRSEEKIKHFSDFISRHFDVRDLGEPRQCLRIEFSREGNNITLKQKGYINEVLRRFGMSDCNPVSTPINPNEKLDGGSNESSNDAPSLPYRELIGCLTYLASSTRPDIAFSASYLG